MKRMKASWRGRFLPLLCAAMLALSVASTAAVSSTLAKYAAVGTGKGEARIAKFEPEWYVSSAFVTGAGGHTAGAIMNGGGFVMHPGNWFTGGWPSGTGVFPTGVGLHKFITVGYRNQSEATVRFRMRVMSGSEREWDPVAGAYKLLEAAANHGTYTQVGEYVHDYARVELVLEDATTYQSGGQKFANDSTGLGAKIGAGGAWIPGWLYGDNMSAWLFYNSGAARWHILSPIPGQGLNGGNWGFNPLTSAPYRPNGSINSAGTASNGSNLQGISQSDPIRFGVGTATIDDMKEKWWKSYRLNLSLLAEQVD